MAKQSLHLLKVYITSKIFDFTRSLVSLSIYISMHMHAHIYACAEFLFFEVHILFLSQVTVTNNYITREIILNSF